MTMLQDTKNLSYKKKTEITEEKEQKESTAKDALDDCNVFLTNKLLILTTNTGR